MSDTPDKDAMAKMETEIHDLAARTASGRPLALTGNLAAAPGPIGATAVAKRLEAVIKRTVEIQKAATILATALAGPAQNDSRTPRPAAESAKSDPLFARQMTALDELALVLEALNREIERAQRILV
jgi:hypothetical protein